MNDRLSEPALRMLAEGAVPEGYDRWPAVRARAAGRHRALSARRTALATGGALTAGVLAALFVRPNAADPLTADALLGRAEAASLGRSVRSYHLTATLAITPPGRPAQVQNREVWVSGGRQRTEYRWGTVAHATISDGRQTWMVVSANGRTYAALVGSSSHGSGPLAPEEVSMSDVLAQLVGESHSGCATARIENSSASVAGRAAHVVTVTPSPTSCPPTGKRSQEPPAEERRTVWIDKQTYLPLRSEERSPKGDIRYEVTRVEYDVAIPDAAFQYAPPPGASVFGDVREFREALARALRPTAAAEGTPSKDKP